MLVAAVVCLCTAAATALLGARALARPAARAGGTQQVLRAVAPTQLAAAVMLAAGGVVALSDHPSVGLLALCIVGALGTLAAGIWQGARYTHAAIQRECQRAGNQRCASCPLSCG